MKEKQKLLKNLKKKYGKKMAKINKLTGSKRIKAIDELYDINMQISNLMKEIGDLPLM